MDAVVFTAPWPLTPPKSQCREPKGISSAARPSSVVVADELEEEDEEEDAEDEDAEDEDACADLVFSVFQYLPALSPADSDSHPARNAKAERERNAAAAKEVRLVVAIAFLRSGSSLEIEKMIHFTKERLAMQARNWENGKRDD